MTSQKETAPRVGGHVGAKDENQQGDYSTPIAEITMAITAIRPVQAKAKGDFSEEQMVCNATAYEIARAIRRVMGAEAEPYAPPLGMDSIEPILERYAKRHNLPFSDLAAEVELLWPVSYGPHRDPWSGALQRWERNPQLIRVSAHNENLNKLATLAHCRHDAIGGDEFTLPGEKVGAILGLSKMQVSRLLLVLVGRGFLERVGDPDHTAKVAAVYIYKGHGEVTGTLQDVTETLQDVTRTLPDVTRTLPVNSLTLKPNNLKRETAKKKTGCADACDPDYLAFEEQWNKLASECGLKKTRTKPADRLNAYKAMAKDPNWEAESTEAMDKIRVSPFLQGKVPGKPWKVTIDWFLEPENFAKILEGNYDDNKPATIRLGAGLQNEGDEPW